MPADPKAIIARLLRRRIVALACEVTRDVANAAIAQLLYLESTDSAAEITLLIDSPGGEVPSSLAIVDTMESIAPPVCTWGIGRTEGTATLILAAGRRGRRFAVPKARVALPLLGAFPGSDASAVHLRRLNAEIRDRLALYTGRDVTVIVAAMDGAAVLGAAEARLFGLVDEIPDDGGVGMSPRPGASRKGARGRTS